MLLFKNTTHSTFILNTNILASKDVLWQQLPETKQFTDGIPDMLLNQGNVSLCWKKLDKLAISMFCFSVLFVNFEWQM